MAHCLKKKRRSIAISPFFDLARFLLREMSLARWQEGSETCRVCSSGDWPPAALALGAPHSKTVFRREDYWKSLAAGQGILKFR
jgi:hypothetical protein